eukprot:6734692-Karenia_brevis.AAC.1
MRFDGSVVEDVIDAPDDDEPLGDMEPTTGPSGATSSSSSSNDDNESDFPQLFFGAANAHSV